MMPIDHLDDDDEGDDVIGDVIEPDGRLQLEHAALVLGSLHCHCHLQLTGICPGYEIPFKEDYIEPNHFISL